MKSQWKMKSPVGTLYLVASEKGLQGVYCKPPREKVPFAKDLSGDAAPVRILAQAVQELEEYFHGGRQNFDVILDAEGTPFQKKVWAQLAKIPFGKTVSYKQIAERLNNGKAFRAVGTANGKNPLSIIVPCHRVIAADGKLGGYSGGLPMKTQLLELEKRNS